MLRRSFLAAAAAVIATPALAAVPQRTEDAPALETHLLRSYLSGALRGQAQTAFPAGAPLDLKRAPHDRFAANTIQVLKDGVVIGKLPGVHSRTLAPLMDADVTLRARVAAPSANRPNTVGVDVAMLLPGQHSEFPVDPI